MFTLFMLVGWSTESRYVLLLSLYDRLGGHVLRWSNLKGQYWNGSTLPVNHQGLYYNAELKVCGVCVCARVRTRVWTYLVFDKAVHIS